jgi:SAM-dependent methyltransferase
MDLEPRSVAYLSPSAPVSMGDWWFDVATTRHFWIRRRFQVMKKMADSVIRDAKHMAEIGCGNGLLQRDIEDRYGKPVAGFELNQAALERNVSRISPLYCYNIHQRNAEFQAKFDLLFLFDVLEHIDEESGFLQSTKFHLAECGTLLINVPAHQSLYSDYDRAAGHVRRYSAKQLSDIGEQNGFKLRGITYWGLPLVPLLLLRKMMSLERSNGRAGFDARGPALNATLSLLARMEVLPQKLLGTSVIAVFSNQGNK